MTIKAKIDSENTQYCSNLLLETHQYQSFLIGTSVEQLIKINILLAV